MTIKEAVVARFLELLRERNMRPNELATLAGVTPSSVYSMLDARRRELSINLIKKLCDGLEISLGTFFSAPVFDEPAAHRLPVYFIRLKSLILLCRIFIRVYNSSVNPFTPARTPRPIYIRFFRRFGFRSDRKPRRLRPYRSIGRSVLPPA